MTLSAAKRGVSVAPRTSAFIMEKMDKGLAVIALNPENGAWAGFCYIEVWQHGKYVANSGLIVSRGYRGQGVSKAIKIRIFEQSRTMFPDAKLFSLTTSPAVIHVNNLLGYKITSYSELMSDPLFLNGCHSWVNYMDLMCNEMNGSRYVAMTFNPQYDIKRAVNQWGNRRFMNRLKKVRKSKVAPVVGAVL